MCKGCDWNAKQTEQAPKGMHSRKTSRARGKITRRTAQRRKDLQTSLEGGHRALSPGALAPPEGHRPDVTRGREWAGEAPFAGAGGSLPCTVVHPKRTAQRRKDL